MDKSNNPPLFHSVISFAGGQLGAAYKDAPLATDITLRDLFAAFALNGLVINPTSLCVDCPLSARAFEIADAMLTERAKP